MDKLRLRFTKTGRAVYISHLDLMHTMQRAFSRAGSRSPVMRRSLRRLRMKFTRWVTRKLTKYPSIPYLGSK